MPDWPTDPAQLVSAQRLLALETPAAWTPPADYLVAGCWVCFSRGLSGPGRAGDPAWGAAVVLAGGHVVGRSSVAGVATAPYAPGMLALRLGPLLNDVVRRLTPRPDVLLVDATGRDHPRRAGLALHLGAMQSLPTVGVTHRPLLATGTWPADEAGATAALIIDTDPVASWLRSKRGTRPLVVHPGWRVDLDIAVQVVRDSLAGRRTPEPLRLARQSARRARAEQ
ncbi:endonuclease V [Kribbella sp. VKM Ac-2527]|uniref:Endonuclease V n=1 Tax=Kribbella caucasensis TaxID=2512215 RepID=A0A4R6K9L6_9ACTN|nr:endonuclease V [Kribbella sp. VKM Ac-2527]TDO46378.1 endonuclease V [Kribbella sp. VKM Ac-2527]